MLQEFTNDKNVTDTGEKISSVYDQGGITDRQVQNWFSKFRSGDTLLKDESRTGCTSEFDQDVLKELMECKSTQKYSRISTWLQHIRIYYLWPLEKDRKSKHENLSRKRLSMGKTLCYINIMLYNGRGISFYISCLWV